MLSRRDLLMGVPAAASLRVPAPAPPPAARELSSADLTPISGAIESLRHLTDSPEVSQIRDRQRTHFKINQKFPAYIDIGLTVWERLLTWHMENHLPLTAKRSADGHMEMDLMFTTLILKWEQAETLIGVAYD
jgi:hypothetical protein